MGRGGGGPGEEVGEGGERPGGKGEEKERGLIEKEEVRERMESKGRGEEKASYLKNFTKGIFVDYISHGKICLL